MNTLLTRWLTLTALLSGCLQTPAAPSPPVALSVEALAAHDALGQETPLLQLARRPTLTLVTNVPLDASGPPLFLFDGPLDAAALDDLTAPPLRLATQARLLDTRIEVQATRTTITPSQPLRPTQQLTLVLAPWATGDASQRFPKDAPPFVAELQVTTEPSGGASIIGSWPAHGASGVPPNLTYAVIASDGAFSATSDSLTLRSEGTNQHEGDAVLLNMQEIDCADVGFLAYTCFKLTPERALAAATGYVLQVEGWIDQTGATIDPWFARFVTAAIVDQQAPVSLPLRCALDEIEFATGCALLTDSQLRVRVATDEPAMVTWSVDACSSRTIAAVGAEAAFTVDGLTPDTEYTLHLSLADAAANRTVQQESFVTTPPLAQVTISEVRFDPVGPEPQQEYVELLNFGFEPVDLRGYALRDDPLSTGDTIERSVILHPGGRVLLVADDFDAANPRDVTPAPGVLVLRMGTSLASGGLSNGGEPLFLVNADGHRLSETPGVASVGAGSCLQRQQPHTRDGRIESFVHDASRPCTPGW